MTRPAVATLPPVAGSATLHVAEGGSLDVTIGAVVPNGQHDASGREQAELMLVAEGRPSGLSAGARAELLWASDEGVLLLPVEIVRVRTIGSMITCSARPAGSVLLVQRRAHRRRDISGPVTLAVPDLSMRLLRGELVDASEAAVRCRLPFRDGQLPPGTRVRSDFAVAGTSFSMEGHVLRHQGVDGAPDLLDVVVFFQGPELGQKRLARTLQAQDLARP